MSKIIIYPFIFFLLISCQNKKKSYERVTKIFDNEDQFSSTDASTPSDSTNFKKMEVYNSLYFDDFLKDGYGPGKDYENELNSVQITKEDKIYLGGYKGLFVSTDEGKTWEAKLQNVNIKDIILKEKMATTPSDYELYLKTSSDYLYSPDSGKSFYSIKPESLTSVYGWMYVDDHGNIFIYGKKDKVYGIFFSKDKGKTYLHINDNDDSMDVRVADMMVKGSDAYISLSELSMGNLGIFKVPVSDFSDGKVNFSWPPVSEIQVSTLVEKNNFWLGFGWDQESNKSSIYQSYDGRNYNKYFHENLQNIFVSRKPYIDDENVIYLSASSAIGLAYSTNRGLAFDFLKLNDGFSHQQNGLENGLIVTDIKRKENKLYVATKSGLVITSLK